LTRLSIIVPAYNAERCIARCVESLLAQRGLEEPPEIIVVDDGSLDSTARIVSRYPEIRLIRQCNKGRGAARNAAIRTAQGHVLLFTDSDCEVEPDWAVEMLRCLETIGTDCVMGATTTGVGVDNIFAKTQQGRDLCGLKEGPLTRFNTNNIGFRGEVVRELMFDEALPRGQDADLGWRLLQAGYSAWFRPSARVHHHHLYTTWKAFLRNGFSEGRASAQIYYKHGKGLPRDLAFFLFALLFLGLSPFWRGFLIPSALCLALFLAALWFNELILKKKPLGLSLHTFPVMFAWYMGKTMGWIYMTKRILLCQEAALITSRIRHRQWLEEVKSR